MTLDRIKSTILIILVMVIFLKIEVAYAQLLPAENTLFDSVALGGWYTENIYSPIDSYNGDTYFIMLDASRRPIIGRISKQGNTTLEPLEKTVPSYRAKNDGHHEFSVGLDKYGYIHVTGDMHNWPQDNTSHTPDDFQSANILYWRSKNPQDISEFEFLGSDDTYTIPGEAWSYGHFVSDRNYELYYVSRTLAREFYYQRGGRGLGLYHYDAEKKRWTARGELAPIEDASFPVIAWENSGRNGGSYQQYKADVQFDANNRMLLTVGMNTSQGPAQVNSIIYAYSDDGGHSFHRVDASSITLPMQTESGERQAEIIFSDSAATVEQPSISHAWDNQPLIFYTLENKGYYTYLSNGEWTGPFSAPMDYRGKVVYSTNLSTLIFVDIHNGTSYLSQSEQGSLKTIKLAETFRYFDIRKFRNTDELNGISWNTDNGKFEVLSAFRSASNEHRYRIRARSNTGKQSIELHIDDQLEHTWEINTTQMSNYDFLTTGEGPVKLWYKNDTNGAVLVDYLQIDDLLFHTEHQNGNTSSLDSVTFECGGIRSEWLQCSGFVDFSNNPILSTEPLLSSDVKVHPNPTNDLLNIQGLDGFYSYSLYNLQGQLVRSTKAVTGLRQLNVDDLPSGLYMLKLVGTSSYKDFKILIK